MSCASIRTCIGLDGVAPSDATYAVAASACLLGMRGTVSYGVQGSVPTEQRPAAANDLIKSVHDETPREQLRSSPRVRLRDEVRTNETVGITAYMTAYMTADMTVDGRDCQAAAKHRDVEPTARSKARFRARS